MPSVKGRDFSVFFFCFLPEDHSPALCVFPISEKSCFMLPSILAFYGETASQGPRHVLSWLEVEIIFF